MTTAARPPASAGHRVERAGASDADILARVIADAFDDLDVSRWLIPDPPARHAIFPGYFALHVEQALADGSVLTSPARDAAALWLPIGPNGPGEPPADYYERLAALTGPHLARFQALDSALGQHHPDGPAHEHLAILAVRPGRQRLGIGTALMNARHASLDKDGTPAYLEASDPAKATIYRTHGYTDIGAPIQLPGGPPMLPMWRQPRNGARPTGSTTDPSPPARVHPAAGTTPMTLWQKTSPSAVTTTSPGTGPGQPSNRRNMTSIGPPLPAQAEDMTVEVRGSSGIPYMQARVIALNVGEALAKASSAHPDTEWVFLRELDHDEIAQIIHDQPGRTHSGPADDPPSSRS